MEEYLSQQSIVNQADCLLFTSTNLTKSFLYHYHREDLKSR